MGDHPGVSGPRVVLEWEEVPWQVPTARYNEAITLEWWRRQSVTMWMVGLQLMVWATVRRGNQCINSVIWKASMGLAPLPVLRAAALKAPP